MSPFSKKVEYPFNYKDIHAPVLMKCWVFGKAWVIVKNRFVLFIYCFLSII